MKTVVSGHRYFKIQGYDIPWIKEQIRYALSNWLNTSYGASGMASGVDLWFCEICRELHIPYEACIPFESQRGQVAAEGFGELRDECLKHAAAVTYCRNSTMLLRSDNAVVIWDGNKGGTYNVFQQLIETKKSFVWIEPTNKRTYVIN